MTIFFSLPHRLEASSPEGPTVVADANVGGGWSEAIAKLRAELATRADVDARARVDVYGVRDKVLVHVTLADGRTAVRHVETPDELTAVVEALLLLPDEARAPAGDATGVALAVVAPHAVTPPARVPTTAAVPSARGAIELDLAVGWQGHLMASPVYLGYGPVVVADVVLDPWVLGAFLRRDLAAPALGHGGAPGVEQKTLGAGLEFGRRFQPWGALFDITAGPRVEQNGQSIEARGGQHVEGARSDFAVGAGARVALPRGSTARFFSSLDAEMVPRRLGGEARIDPALPVLPAWALGVTAGASWALP